jgi:tRNA A58 N-methylase Trm61
MEFNATERLELQNEVLRTAFGGIVFAPIDLHAGDKVLDVGTGSGLWSLVISFLDLTV